MSVLNWLINKKLIETAELLTLVHLIANYNEKRDTTAEHVENDADRVDCLPRFATHAVYDVLKVGRLFAVRAVGQY